MKNDADVIIDTLLNILLIKDNHNLYYTIETNLKQYDEELKKEVIIGLYSKIKQKTEELKKISNTSISDISGRSVNEVLSKLVSITITMIVNPELNNYIYKNIKDNKNNS